MKNVLILGGTGYLGNYISKALLDEGFHLILLIRQTSNINYLKRLTNVDFLYLDDKEISNKIQCLKIDIFINAAVEYGRINNSYNVFETNVHLPLFVINNLNNVERILIFSFDSFYSKSEFRQYNILPFYIISKLQFNQWVEKLCNEKGLTAIVLRLEHLVGKDEKINKFNGWIIDQCKNNKGIIELTEGNQVRDFIYVEDIITAIFILLKNENIFKNKFSLLDIGTGKGYTLKYFIETIHSVTNSVAKLDFGAKKYDKNEIMNSIADNTILKNLGWKPLEKLDLIINKIL